MDTWVPSVAQLLNQAPQLHSGLLPVNAVIAGGLGPAEQMLPEGGDHWGAADVQGHQRLCGADDQGDVALVDEQVIIRVFLFVQRYEEIIFVLLHEPQNVFQVEAVGLGSVPGLAGIVL